MRGGGPDGLGTGARVLGREDAHVDHARRTRSTASSASPHQIERMAEMVVGVEGCRSRSGEPGAVSRLSTQPTAQDLGDVDPWQQRPDGKPMRMATSCQTGVGGAATQVCERPCLILWCSCRTKRPTVASTTIGKILRAWRSTFQTGTRAGLCLNVSSCTTGEFVEGWSLRGTAEYFGAWVIGAMWQDSFPACEYSQVQAGMVL